MVTKIKNGRLILPNGITEGELYIRDGILVPSCKNIDIQIDAEGCYVSAGFIDLHVHGGDGYDFIDGSPDAYLSASLFHKKHGTTSLLPTLLTAPKQEIIDSLKAYSVVKKEYPTETAGFLGVHMEGPYFAMSQKGAQDSLFFTDISQKDYQKYYEICPDIIRWSAAPEIDKTGEFATFCNKNNILLSVAHSDALYSDILKARIQGYRMFTHFYSALSGIVRKDGFRTAGAVEAGYLFDDMYTEIIADLKHLPCELIQLVYKIKGANRNILITDAMRAAGQQGGFSILGSLKSGQKVLIEDGVAKLPDRSAFAGSIATADTLIRNVVSCGIGICDAVKMMTLTPAKIIGRNDIGEIITGKRADLLIFDDNICIKNVFQNGVLLEDI